MIELLTFNGMKMMVSAIHIILISEVNVDKADDCWKSVKSEIHLANGTKVYSQTPIDEIHVLIRGY